MSAGKGPSLLLGRSIMVGVVGEGKWSGQLYFRHRKQDGAGVGDTAYLAGLPYFGDWLC